MVEKERLEEVARLQLTRDLGSVYVIRDAKTGQEFLVATHGSAVSLLKLD